MKRFFLFFHRWFGLIVGIIILIEGLTGCIYCFQDELKDYFHKDYRLIEYQNGQVLQSPSQLKQTVERALPESTIVRILYNGPDRSVCVMSKLSSGDIQMTYIHPYTGQILHTENMLSDFFYIILYTHMYLLIPGTIGKTIIGIANLSFVVLLISGLILWWPNRKQDRKRSFTIKWGARFKRINYDFHNVLGFYTLGFCLIIAFTGMVFSFESVKNGTFQIFNLGQGDLKEISKLPDLPKEEVYVSDDRVLDDIFMQLQDKHRGEMIWLYLPNAKMPAYGVRVYHKILRYNKVDEYYYNAKGEDIASRLYDQASLGKRVVLSNYDLHTGQLLGLTGKCLMFCTSLLITTMPITGFMIWKSKRRKKVKKK